MFDSTTDLDGGFGGSLRGNSLAAMLDVEVLEDCPEIHTSPMLLFGEPRCRFPPVACYSPDSSDFTIE